MRAVYEMSPVIIGAIKLMSESFGNTNVKLISKGMYRLNPDAQSPLGTLGADIEIEGMKVFLGYQQAEDILIYGQKAADSFVFKIIEPEYKRSLRKLKIQEIHPDID